MSKLFYALGMTAVCLILAGCAGQSSQQTAQIQALAAQASAPAAVEKRESGGDNLLKTLKAPAFILCGLPDAGNPISNMMMNVMDAALSPRGSAADRQARAVEEKYGPGHLLIDMSRDCARGKPGAHPEKLMTYQQWISR